MDEGLQSRGKGGQVWVLGNLVYGLGSAIMEGGGVGEVAQLGLNSIRNSYFSQLEIPFVF